MARFQDNLEQRERYHMKRMGWDRGWVMAFTLVTSLLERRSTGHPLYFLEKLFFLVEIDEVSLLNVVHVQQLLSHA